jgi:ankyrin repeat protein
MKKIISLLLFLVATAHADGTESLNDYLVNNQDLPQATLAQEVLKRLAAGDGINVLDLQGNTPLMTAITLGLNRVAIVLLDRSANWKIHNLKRETALSLATTRQEKEHDMQDVINAIEARKQKMQHRSKKSIPENLFMAPGLEA